MPANPTLHASGSLSVDHLASEWSVSKRTIYRWIKADPKSGVTVPLPSRKVGRRIFFITSEILEWLRQYGPSGSARIDDVDDDAQPVPSGKIQRRKPARKASR